MAIVLRNGTPFTVPRIGARALPNSVLGSKGSVTAAPPRPVSSIRARNLIAGILASPEWPLAADRIFPTDLLESGEVRVSGADGESVLDRERRQVSIGDEISAQVVRGNELGQDVGVALGRERNPGRLGCEPVLHLLPRGRGGEGMLACTRMGADPQERHQRLPRESDPTRAVQLFGEPPSRGDVQWARAVDGE